MRTFNLDYISKLFEAMKYSNHPDSDVTEKDLEFLQNLYRNLITSESMSRHTISLPIYIQLVLLGAFDNGWFAKRILFWT